MVSTNTHPLIELRDVTFGYGEEKIFSHVDLTIYPKEFLAIAGPNGSGKSTLLKLLLGFLQPDGGSAFIERHNVKDFVDWSFFGYVPQVTETFSLPFPVTALEVVRLNLGPTKFNRRLRRRYLSMAEDALSMVGMVHLKHRPFNQMSGGQQQRVMIAKALVHSPKVLVLDEPTAGLDQASQDAFFDVVHHLNQRHDITVIMVTHDLDAVKDYATSVITIKEGGICHVDC